jgi:hypothetical protein
MAAWPNGGDDAAARPRHILITRTLKPHLEFARPVAAVHDMGVAIDQRRGDQAAFKIQRFEITETGGQILFGSAQAMRPSSTATAPFPPVHRLACRPLWPGLRWSGA